MGRCAPTTGIAPFGELVEQVATQEPYASARRVFWVVDNGSSHAGLGSIERIRQAWPTAQLVHLPIHASWLNQVEIFFSIVQRKVIKPANFTDLLTLERRLLQFQVRYNDTASPFNWRYTKADLNAYLQRLAAHESLSPAACPRRTNRGTTSAGTAMLGLGGFVLLAVSSAFGELEQAIETTATSAWCKGCGVTGQPHGGGWSVGPAVVGSAGDVAVAQAAVALRGAGVCGADLVEASEHVRGRASLTEQAARKPVPAGR